MRRGQVSLEFLIILAAFLAFLAVWIPVLGKINSGAQQGIAVGYAKESAVRLAAALDDVCMLGQGNVRVVEMRLAGPAQVEGKGKKVFVTGKTGEYAVSADRLCGSGQENAFVFELEGDSTLKVWSEDGLERVQVIKE